MKQCDYFSEAALLMAAAFCSLRMLQCKKADHIFLTPAVSILPKEVMPQFGESSSLPEAQLSSWLYLRLSIKFLVMSQVLTSSLPIYVKWQMQKRIKNTSSTVSLPASKVGSFEVGRAKISQPSRPPIPVQGQVLERVAVCPSRACAEENWQVIGQ
jgi:hypothetical protein